MTKAEKTARRFREEKGLPANPRRLNFYGRFKRNLAARKWRYDIMHRVVNQWGGDFGG